MEETNMTVPDSGTQEADSPNQTVTESMNQAAGALIEAQFTYRGRALVQLSEREIRELPPETEVLIRHRRSDSWWLSPSNGTTEFINDAHVYTLSQLRGAVYNEQIMFRIMPVDESETQAPPPAPDPSPAPTDADLYDLVMTAHDLRNFIRNQNRPDLWERECHYRHPVTKMYYTSRDVWRGDSITNIITEAAVTTVDIVLRTMELSTSEVCILKLKPLPEGKKLLIDQVLPLSVIELMRVAPRNEQVRGNLLRIFKQMPPIELDTFEKIRDWIEANCEPPVATPAPVQPSNVGRRNVPQLTLEFIEAGIETGRCTYRVSRSSVDRSSFTLDDLREWIEDGDDMESIKSRMVSQAGDEFDASGYSYGGYGYDNEETTGFDSDGIEINTPNAETRIRDFLEANDPDLLEQLDNN